MKFDDAYKEYMDWHQQKRKGERLRRLQEGHGHAEKLFLENVWWPAFGQFNYLHPEYEVSDFKDGSRYLDFAYIRRSFLVAIEIDGFGPHARNLNRWQFADQLHRQNHLMIDGWKVIRFAYDEVNEKPRNCQQTLQQLFGRWLGDGTSVAEATFMEKEVVRLALRLTRAITPKDVCDCLGIERRYAGRLLQGLVRKGWLQTESGKDRIRSYRLILEGKNFVL